MKRNLFAVFPVLLLALTACSSGPKEVTDMAYTAEVCGESFNGTYTGTVLDDLPNGAGTFTCENSKESLTYTGQWENGSIVGTGELEYDGYKLKYNETEYTGIYSGEAENGYPCGEGTYEGEKRDKYLAYEGSWKDGAFAGEGYLEANEYIVYMADDVKRVGKYIGKVRDGIPSGEGSYTTKNGVGVTYTHKGQWENGRCNGYGERRFEHDDYYTFYGDFINGEFTPTPSQLFTSIGTWPKAQFSVNSKAAQILEENPNVFLNHSIDDSNLEIDSTFKFKDYAKNQEAYGDKLITVSMTVVQILENDYFGNNCTRCIGRDGNGNFYYMFMYGSAEGIYNRNWIKATILPLDYFTYVDLHNTTIWAMASAAVTITK